MVKINSAPQLIIFLDALVNFEKTNLFNRTSLKGDNAFMARNLAFYPLPAQGITSAISHCGGSNFFEH